MDSVHRRFGTRDAAEYAVSALLEAGFAPSMISLRHDGPVWRGVDGVEAETHTWSYPVTRTRAVGMLGGIVGASLGATFAPFALSVPSASMTESALFAVATGACVIGALGSRVALYLSPQRDEEVDDRTPCDRSVVMVRARVEHADRATRILERCGGGCVDSA